MPAPVKHSLELKWDVDASGTLTNPRIKNPDVYIGGLHFRYACEYGNNKPEFPYKMFLELIDPAVNDFDPHWTITVEYMEFNNIRTFSQACRRPERFYVFKPFYAAKNEWALLEFDVHAYHKSYHNEAEAKNSGNDYRVELTEDDGVVWVNRDFLVMDSEFFQEQLLLEANSGQLRLDDVNTADFLDYVYSVHPPTLKLSLGRVGGIWKLAKRFGNQTVISMCEAFLEDFQPEFSTQRCGLLIEADHFGLTPVFTRALNSMSENDFKALDMIKACRFSPENLQKIVKRLTFKSREKEQPYAALDFTFLLDVAKAQKRGYDCTIFIEGWKSTPIYARKAILAGHSKYFKALFFGQFSEANSEAVTLKDLDFHSFLEYLASVYTPSPPLTMSRVDALLRTADRFQNELLLKQCGDFLLHCETFSSAEKLQVLYLADEFGLDTVLTAMLERVTADELKDVDFSAVARFRPESMRQYLDRLKHIQ